MLYSPERLSINEICTKGWSSIEFVQRCADADVPFVSLWRDSIAAAGVASVRAALDATGVEVSSVCRAGMFTGSSAAQRQTGIDDSRAAIAETAALGASTLVVVAGPVVESDLVGGRRQVVEGLEQIVDDARAAGVRLAIEPFHPMLIADRSVLVTLESALRLVEQFPADVVGLALDAYHVFWDPELADLIERATGRIECAQVSDWIIPIEGGLSSRGLPGQGCIDLAGFGACVERTGYRGPVEVEIFNARLWAMNPADAFAEVLDSYRSLSAR